MFFSFVCTLHSYSLHLFSVLLDAVQALKEENGVPPNLPSPLPPRTMHVKRKKKVISTENGVCEALGCGKVICDEVIEAVSLFNHGALDCCEFRYRFAEICDIDLVEVTAELNQMSVQTNNATSSSIFDSLLTTNNAQNETVNQQTATKKENSEKEEEEMEDSDTESVGGTLTQNNEYPFSFNMGVNGE